MEESLSLINIKRLKHEMDEKIFRIEEGINGAKFEGEYYLELTKYLHVLLQIRLYLIEVIENSYL